MPQSRHMQDTLVSARLVSVRGATGCIGLVELAAASDWPAPSLEMVGFTIDQGVRQAQQTTLAQYSAQLHNVRVVSGMAGIGDLVRGEYICDSVHENRVRLKKAWYAKYGLHLDEGDTCRFHCGAGEPLQVANAICFFGWANRNYAHWLSEKLGRFYWINQASLPDDTVVLVEAGLPESIMDSLALFWPPERTLCIQRGRACDVAVLHYFSDTADIWEPSPGFTYRGDEYHLYPTAIAWMAERVKARCKAVEGQGKAYLPRPPGGNGRAIVNQQELIYQLRDYGFQAFRPEQHDFASQVCCLAACDVAVLGSGAAAANALWMPRGTILVILIQDSPQMWYWFFHALAAAVGVQVIYHRVKALSGTHNVLFHQNVEVPIPELCNWLSRLDGLGIKNGCGYGEMIPILDRLGAGLAQLREFKNAKRQSLS